MEQFANNPTKKPVASIGLYLPNRIFHLLAKSDKETNSKERLRLAERALEYVRAMRKQSGFTDWAAIAFAVCFIVVLAVAVAPHWPKTFIYDGRDYRIRILKQINTQDFVLQVVYKGVPQTPAVMHFCRDYRPRFEIGETLTRLAYDDHGSCQSLGPEDRGYVIERDSSYWPTLPKNCTNLGIGKPVVCDGTPQF